MSIGYLPCAGGGQDDSYPIVPVMEGTEEANDGIWIAKHMTDSGFQILLSFVSGVKLS